VEGGRGKVGTEGGRERQLKGKEGGKERNREGESRDHSATCIASYR
jgi:hypothetical protein